MTGLETESIYSEFSDNSNMYYTDAMNQIIDFYNTSEPILDIIDLYDTESLTLQATEPLINGKKIKKITKKISKFFNKKEISPFKSSLLV